MPIKFRCNQCKQFLGISRSRAGTLVDCPACGRTIRVPQLDGHLEPLPEPALDLEDSSLAQALDELAMIGQESEAEPPADPAAEEAKEPAEIIEPVPSPEPVVIEPLPAAEPVPVPESPPTEQPTVKQSGPEFTASSSKAPVLSAPDDVSAKAVSTVEELAALAAAPTIAHPAVAVPVNSWRSHFPPTVLVSMFSVAVLTFVLGYLTGRGLDTGNTSSPPASNGDQAATGNGKAGTANGAATASDSSSRSPALKGRITFKNKDGDSRPDRGARVIVFPPERRGEAKLSIIGFRAAGSEPDFQLAAAGLRALGGDVAIVDDEGNFDVWLPSPGTYQILVISHFQSRDEQEPREPALANLLRAYFDRPEQLLGQVAYHHSQVRYKGEGTEIWDHSFQRAL